MTSITKHLNRLLSLKWVRKYLHKGSTTSLHTEDSSQKYPCQCSEYKVIGSVSSNRSSPGTVNDQTEPVSSYEETYQYHQPSDTIWENPIAGPEETNKGINPRLQKQHPAFLSPAQLKLLEPPLPPPQNKPLPKIPTQGRPRNMPDRVGQKVQDPGPPPQNLSNTIRKTTTTYSPFPKLAIIPPPRSSSLQHLLQPYEKTYRSQRLPYANTTVNKQLHCHAAELYQGTSMERENTVNKLRDVPIEELLPRVTRSPSLQKRVIRSEIAPCEGRVSIALRSSRSVNYLSMHKSEPCPRFTKKSVPNLRRAAKYDSL
ncbi:uncharacterized protein BKA55DRAFT_1395 [Fusarium redolens]|uniref:Uncharacterized protein n=1 Tax=Fusarium redolens TaxID=48865 RepID=A0A9P9R7E5_FUSRE|nr:uncharacterized protein BKA55DRAFT_1395 [Fusarium redolens]KAH7269091.1 hypothetical protein BKA55DRAFT_1395 [Fusarium redolens]